jgi:predicted phosphodiesterase
LRNLFLSNLINKLNKKESTLVIAGDLGLEKDLDEAFNTLCNAFTDVVYTPGNHEFYRSSFESVRNTLSILSNKYKNLHVLDRGVTEIRGQRFVGTTLWFPYSKECDIYSYYLNDFSKIEGFKNIVYKENDMNIDFLKKNVKEGDIVVTHHMPTSLTTPPRFWGEKTNIFYYTNMEETIKENKPKFWLFGHTHDSVVNKLFRTRLLCNPYGYNNCEENREFNPKLGVEND